MKLFAAILVTLVLAGIIMTIITSRATNVRIRLMENEGLIREGGWRW
jgi:hypothetical protein